MNSKTQKGLRPFVLKIAVVVMGVCYTLGPSHNEIFKLLHILSHQLEMPGTVLSHSESGGHHHHNHNNVSAKHKNNHQHGFLEFINKVLMASSAEHNADNTNIKSYKIDKHIITQEYDKVQQAMWSLAVKHVFSKIKNNTLEGFLNSVFQPPKVIWFY